MILNLTNKVRSEVPFLTLGRLLQLDKSIDEVDFKMCNSLPKCIEKFNYVRSNWNLVCNLLRNESNRDKLSEVWSQYMLDIDWDKCEPMRYPESVELALIRVNLCKLDEISGLKEIFTSVGIDLTYVNKSTDKFKVTLDNGVCTKRMVRYFPELLTKTSRSSYIYTRIINPSLGIKSGNFYYIRSR